MRGLLTFPARHPWFALGAVAVISLGAAVFLPRLHIDSSMETIFLDDDPEREVYEEFKRTFGEDEVIVLAFRVSEGDIFQPATLGRIDRITRAIKQLPDELGVDRVVSVTDVDDVRAIEGGFETRPLMSGVPEDPKELEEIKRRALENPLYLRNLVSADAKAGAINVFLDYRPKDRDYKQNLIDRLRQVIAAEPGPEEFHLAGIPVLTAYTSEYLRRDMAIFVPLSLLVMAVTLWLTFRNLTGVLIPLLTVGIAILWTLGFICILGKSISIISSVIPSLLLTLGCAFTVHLLSHYSTVEAASAAERVERTCAEISSPIVLSGLTTVLGFGSLITNDVTQIYEFGLYSGFGILSAMVLAVWFAPAILALVRPRPAGLASEVGEATWLARLLRRVVAIDLSHPHLVLLGGLLSLGLGVWGATRLVVDTDYASNFKKSSPPVQALLFMRKHLSGERPVNVVLRAKKAGENAALEPEFLKKVEAVELYLLAHELIATKLSIAGYLKRMNRAMFDDADEAHVLPSTRRLGAQYIDMYGRPSEVRRFLSDDRQAVVVVGRSSIISSQEFLAFTEVLREKTKGLGDELEVTLTGSMYLLSKASVEIARGQAKSLVFSSLSILVAALIVFRFKSIKFGLIAFLPNALPILLNFGVMGLAGVALTTGTSIIAGMALGIVDDDTIHFLTRYRLTREALPVPAAIRDTLAHTGRPVVFTAITNALGFLVMCFSSFEPLIALGWLTAVTMFTALLGDLFLLPALLVLLDRGKTTETRHA